MRHDRLNTEETMDKIYDAPNTLGQVAYGNACNQAKRDNAAERAQMAAQAVSEVACRVTTLVDRLCGTLPAPPVDKGQLSVVGGGGLLSAIEYSADEIRRATSHIHTELDRLNNAL